MSDMTDRSREKRVAISRSDNSIELLPSGLVHYNPDWVKPWDPESNDSSIPLWYKNWLDQQMTCLPPSLTDYIHSQSAIFNELARIIKPGISIETMAEHLVEADLVLAEESETKLSAARAITFATLGWMTMLYSPAFGTCPPQQMAIADLMDGYIGQAYMQFKQDLSRLKRPLAEFLLGFGIMLPKENLCISADQEDCQAFEKFVIVTPREINVAVLQSLGRINIKWVDVMAPHLEFDKATNTLFLFRYPSFCLLNLSSKRRGSVDGPLNSCASPENARIQWASVEEISQLLQEILLSYRLLFGQSKESRSAFKSMKIFAAEPDPYLDELCTAKAISLPGSCSERDAYRLSRDFPILRSRIATLNCQMSILKPWGWKQLWKDKRDSASWLTFWAVILFGGAGLFLSLAQVLLQIVQIVSVN